jgi:hypothetical protein
MADATRWRRALLREKQQWLIESCENKSTVSYVPNVCRLWTHNSFSLECEASKLSLIITGQLRCINMRLHDRLNE